MIKESHFSLNNHNRCYLSINNYKMFNKNPFINIQKHCSVPLKNIHLFNTDKTTEIIVDDSISNELL